MAAFQDVDDAAGGGELKKGGWGRHRHSPSCDCEMASCCDAFRREGTRAGTKQLISTLARMRGKCTVRSSSGWRAQAHAHNREKRARARTYTRTHAKTDGRVHAISVCSDEPEQVIELRHVLGQRVGRHRRQVSVHRRAAGQPAVGRVGVALRGPARVRVRRHPARARGIAGAGAGAVQAYSRTESRWLML